MSIREKLWLRRKPSLIIGSLVVLGLFGLGMILFREGRVGPRLIFEEDTIDLGEVDEGETKDVVFRFHNEGGQLLVIYGVELSCACQNVEILPNVVPPGGRGELRAKLMPTKRGGEGIDVFTVRSNDIKNPIQQVLGRRFVVLRTVVHPNQLVIRHVDGSPNSASEVTVLGPTKDHDFKILKVETDRRELSALFQCLGRTPDDRSRWHLVVSAESNSRWIKQETATITLFTSDNRIPTIPIPVTIENNGPLCVAPASLSFVATESSVRQKSLICIVYSGQAHIADLDPNVSLSEHLSIHLQSRTRQTGSTEWIYEVETDMDMNSASPTAKGQINFDFPQLGEAISVPVSMINMKGMRHLTN